MMRDPNKLKSNDLNKPNVTKNYMDNNGNST